MKSTRYKPYSANSFDDNIEGFSSDNDQAEQTTPDFQKEIDGLQSQVNTLQSQESQIANDEAALKTEISTLEASIAKNKKIIIGSLIVLGVISIVALIKK